MAWQGGDDQRCSLGKCVRDDLGMLHAGFPGVAGRILEMKDRTCADHLVKRAVDKEAVGSAHDRDAMNAAARVGDALDLHAVGAGGKLDATEGRRAELDSIDAGQAAGRCAVDLENARRLGCDVGIDLGEKVANLGGVPKCAWLDAGNELPAFAGLPCGFVLAVGFQVGAHHEEARVEHL